MCCKRASKQRTRDKPESASNMKTGRIEIGCCWWNGTELVVVFAKLQNLKKRGTRPCGAAARKRHAQPLFLVGSLLDGWVELKEGLGGALRCGETPSIPRVYHPLPTSSLPQHPHCCCTSRLHLAPFETPLLYG